MTALTEHLTAHPLYYDEEQDNHRCECGWVPDYEALDYTADAAIPAHKALELQHAAHVEAELLSAGIVAVQLPEANRVGRWVANHSFSNPGYLKWSVGISGGGVIFASARRGEGSEGKAIQDHRDFAAAILAAASVADRPTPTPGGPTP